MHKHLSILPLGLALALPATGLMAAEPDREFECLIEPNMMIEVSSPVDGVIDSIEVDKADVIEAGQVLAQLEASVQRAQVEQARARAAMDGEIRAAEENVKFTRRKLKRINDLYSSQAVAPQQKDESETEARLASMELRKAKEDKRLAELELQKAIEALNQRTIRSPIEGVVVQRFLSPGESVKDKPIVSIAQIDPLRVEVILPAKEFGSIQAGMQAEIRPETSGGKEYPAIVTIVDKVIDAASGTFGVRLELPNPDYALPGGLNCRVTFRPDLPLKELPPRQVLASGANGVPSPDVGGDVLSRDVQDVEQADDPAIAVPTCLAVGPLPAGAKTDRLIAAIGKVATRVDRAGSGASASGASRYLVLSDPQPSEADARSLARQLRDKGVTDIAVLLNGQFQHRISLGVFSSQQNALSRQKQVQSLGFDADVISRRGRTVTRGGGVQLEVEVGSEADVVKVEQLVGAAVRGRPPVERIQCPQAMSAALN